MLLTAREHYLAHWLLYKFNEGEAKYRMAHAWFCMSRSSNNQSRRLNSRLFEKAKIAHGEATSFFHKGKKLNNKQLQQRVENNPNSRETIIGDISFKSRKAAAEYYNVSTRLIRSYLNGEIELKYLQDPKYRITVKNKRISESKIGKNKGRSYVDIYGEEKAAQLIELRKEARKGYKLSEKTKNKISESKKGKSSWSKGAKFTEDHRNNISKSKLNVSRSSKSYKIIDPAGKEYTVINKGLRWFWKNILNEKFPTTFKKVKDFKEGKNGKWKGWKVYVLPAVL